MSDPGDVERERERKREREREPETVRCWLVERDYDTQGLVTVVYSTRDGRRRRLFQWAAASLDRREITAAIDVDPNSLEPVDPEDRERYAAEARRVAERRDPDEEI